MKSLLTPFLVILVSSSLFGQWVSSNGPSGGGTYEITRLNSDLWISALNGGAYKSTDDGATWTRNVAGLPTDPRVESLMEDNGVLYAAIYQNGLYKLADGDESWTAINTGIENITFRSFIVDGTDIYGSDANGGVYYSSNSGTSYVEKSDGVSAIDFQDFTIFNSEVYAGGSSVYKTSDNGDTWEEVTISGLDVNGAYSMTSSASTIYVGGLSGGIFTSSNGTDWTKSTFDVGGTITEMGVSGDSVYLTTSLGKIYFSNDDGANWELTQNSSTESFVRGLLIEENLMIMSSGDGVFVSTDDGDTWSQSNTGILGLEIITIACTDTHIFVGTDDGQGIFRGDKSGNWTKITNGLDALNATTVHSIVVVDDQIFIGTGGGVYLSDDSGDNWTRKLDPGLNKSALSLDYGADYFATGVNGDGIYISTNGGEDWNLATTTNLSTETSYTSIDIAGDTIVVSTADGEIFVSKDVGVTWTDISIPGDFFHSNKVEMVGETLYTGTTKGLLHSKDLGENWTFVINEDMNITGFIVDGNKIYASSDDGVLITSLLRDTWTEMNDGFISELINEIMISDNKIYAGTFSNSLWERPVEELNLQPIVLGSSESISSAEDTPFTLTIDDLEVDDDNVFPDDFTMTLIEGSNYEINEDQSILPDLNFYGTLQVRLTVNDGSLTSPEIDIAVMITPVNDAPVITDQATALTTTMETAIGIELSFLSVEDVDNDYPEDFTLTVMDGDNYTVANNVVTPASEFIGTISVPVVVNDGELDSEAFTISIDVVEPLGLDDHLIGGNFAAFPNPVLDYLNIESKHPASKLKVDIYAMDGSLLFSKELTNVTEDRINLDAIPNGPIVLKLSSEDYLGVVRLIKQ